MNLADHQPLPFEPTPRTFVGGAPKSFFGQVMENWTYRDPVLGVVNGFAYTRHPRDPNVVLVRRRSSNAGKVREALFALLSESDYAPIDFDWLAAATGLARETARLTVGSLVQQGELENGNPKGVPGRFRLGKRKVQVSA